MTGLIIKRFFKKINIIILHLLLIFILFTHITIIGTSRSIQQQYHEDFLIERENCEITNILPEILNEEHQTPI